MCLSLSIHFVVGTADLRFRLGTAFEEAGIRAMLDHTHTKEKEKKKKISQNDRVVAVLGCFFYLLGIHFHACMHLSRRQKMYGLH